MSFSPGDVLIHTLQVAGPRGSLDLSLQFVSASVYESIYTAGIACEIHVLDPNDALGNLVVSGDERIFFSFQTPGGKKLDYKFSLNSVNDMKSAESLKAKEYTLHGLSTEILTAKTNIIQKSYNTTCSNMVSDIYKTFMGGAKKLETESTRGVQELIIPNLKPLAAIDMIRRRSVSATNTSSAYLFFENQNGYNYVTLESLFKKNVQKTFKQDNTVGSDFLNSSTHDNILAWKLERQMNAAQAIASGGLKQDVVTFDFETLQFKRQSKTVDQGSFSIGGLKGALSGAFRGAYGKKSGSDSIIPVDSRLPQTGIADSTADQKAYTSAVSQSYMNFRAPGDTYLVAGLPVDLKILKRAQDQASMSSLDVLASGKWLVSALRHEIGPVSQRPRYTVVCECIRGGVQ